MRVAAPGYHDNAEAWLIGAHPAYQRLADALVRLAPPDWMGRLVLDLGAGTGTASNALRARGVNPVALDAAPAMLVLARTLMPDLTMVAADAFRLPFADATFDGAVSAFCINHAEDPAAMLTELARVVRPGGAVLASTFGAEPEPVAKLAVEDVARRYGWVPSPWHLALKHNTQLTDESHLLESCAAQAGLTQVEVIDQVVDTALRSPAELVRWRLGLGELAAFVTSLDPVDRDRLVAEATAAVAATADSGPRRSPQSLMRRVLMLSSRAPA